MDASDNIKSEETLIAEVVVKDPNEIMEVEQGTADQMDIRFEIGNWQLEMGEPDAGEILDATIGQVRIPRLFYMCQITWLQYLKMLKKNYQ